MTVRNIKKNLAGAEDLLHGIGVETQSRGGAFYDMHKLDTYVPTYDVTEMQRSSLTFMRLYGTDTAYTDYRRNPIGTVGIPSDLGGVWEPISSANLPVCGNFTYGAYVFSSDCVVGYNNSFMQWNGALPKVVDAGSTPATSGGISPTAWIDRTDRADLTLRADLADAESTVSVAGVAAKDLAYKNGNSANEFNVAESFSESAAIPQSQLDRKLIAGIDKPEIIAHRGFSILYPENTMIAFESALKDGADGIECDLSVSSDGMVVICHDATIDRTSDGTGNIADLTYAQLLSYDFAAGTKYSGEQIPTLTQVVKLCKHLNKRCVLELKNLRSISDIDIIVQAIVDLDAEANCILISFTTSHLQYVRTLNNKIAVGQVFEGTVTDAFLNTVAALGNVYFSARYDITTEALSNSLRSRGITPMVWTIYKSDERKKQHDKGFRIITADLFMGDVL